MLRSQRSRRSAAAADPYTLLAAQSALRSARGSMLSQMPAMAYAPTGVIDYSDVPRSRSGRRSLATYDPYTIYGNGLQQQQMSLGLGSQTINIPLGLPMNLGIGGGVASSKSVPSVVWASGAKIAGAWSTKGEKDFQWKDICEVDVAGVTGKLDAVKDKVVVFSDDKMTDVYSEHLSPAYGGALPILVPMQHTYPSPMHYVESMKMVSSASPAMLLAGIGSGIMPGQPQLDACDFARSQSDMIASQPYASVVKSVAGSCGEKALKAGFYKPESVLCRFWISLWIALWAKYQLYPKYMSALIGTGKKLLVYETDDKLYGMDSTGAGANGTGILLMMMRLMASKGYLSNRYNSPTAVYDKYVRPLLESILTPDGNAIA